MKRPSLLTGLWIAIALTALAIPLKLVFVLAFEPRIAFNLLIGTLIGTAISIQLSRSERAVGRTVLGVGSFLILVGAAFQVSGVQYCIIAASLLWVSRAVLSYGSLLTAGADLGLTTASLASAFWAYSRFGNLLWGIWAFFLVQALVSKIPRSVSAKVIPVATKNESRFDQAYNSAEHALRQIIQGAG